MSTIVGVGFLALFGRPLALGDSPPTGTFAKASAAAQKGAWTSAESLYRACRRDPETAAACVTGRAEALSHLHQPYEALLELEDLLKGEPSYVPALELRGELLEKVVKDHASAADSWTKASVLDPADPRIWRFLGALYHEQSNFQKALDCWRKAVALRPQDPALLAGLAWSYAGAGEPEMAEQTFRKALDLNDRRPRPDPEPLLFYGAFLRRGGRAAECIPLFTRLVQAGGGNALVYLERGAAFEELGEHRRAEADALQALRLGGDHRDVRLLLLRVYRSQNLPGKVAQQQAAIEKLAAGENAQLSAMRESSEALSAAEASVAKGDFKAAIRSYETVTRLRPYYEEAWLPLGVCYSQTGQFGEAEQALKRYLELQPLSSDGHAALGLLYLGRSQFDKAKAELNQALSLDPSDTEAAIGLVRVRFLLADYAGALSLANQWINREANSPELFALAADACSHAGDWKAALGYCRRGLALQAGDLTLQKLHANLLLSCVAEEACKVELFSAAPRHADSPDYQKAAARAFVLLNPWDESTAKIVQATRATFPEDPETWLIEAQWRAASNHPEDAVACARKALSSHELNDSLRVTAYAALAHSLDTLDKTAESREAFEQSWRLNTRLGLVDRPAALAWSAFLEEHEEPGPAGLALDELIAKAPDFAPARLARARLFFKQGKLSEAVKQASASLTYKTDSSSEQQAHNLLAKAYSALGRTKDAETNAAWIASHP